MHDNCLTCPYPICIEDLKPAQVRQMIQAVELQEPIQEINQLRKQGIPYAKAVAITAAKLELKHPSQLYRKLKNYRRNLEKLRAIQSGINQNERPGD